MISYKKKLFLFYLILSSILSLKLSGQGGLENFDNKGLYKLIDELANDNIIIFNTSIKPYSRNAIYNALVKALDDKLLTNTQRKKINNYLNNYPNFYKSKKYKSEKIFINSKNYSVDYQKSSSNFSIKPIWGYNFKKSESKVFEHFYGGLEFNSNINKNWHMYANLRDNTMSEPIALPSYFTNTKGGNYKLGLQNDYSEMKGGIIYSFDWGNVGLIKDHVQWGDNYFGSNIFSGRTPSFPIIKFNAFINNRIELNYFHGWINSEVIDSTNSYIATSGFNRRIFKEKFIAANMISLRLLNNSFLSFGNSIIYSDLGGIHPGYLIPFFLYKSIDHTINHNASENQNSQLFFNLSFREIKHLHFFSSLFIDELKKDRFFSANENNFLSFKIGSKISNWPLKNLSNIFEINYTNPMTYLHTVDITTFESNGYNLGHFLRDNSSAFNYQISYNFKNRFNVSFDYFNLTHFDNFEYSWNNEYNPTSVSIRENKTWDWESFKLSISKEFLINLYIEFSYQISNTIGYEDENYTSDYYLELFSPEIYRGKNEIFSANINIGF